MKEYGKPTRAKPCRCPEPVGDPREGTCVLCGHQVPGFDLPARGVFSFGVGDDRSTFASATRRYRPAA